MRIADELLDRMVRNACEKAAQLKLPVNIAIVDDGGHLLRFVRLEGSTLTSVAMSQDKAYTAAACGLATHTLYEIIKDDPALLRGIPEYPRIVVLGGGSPIHLHGTLVGGVGVSGGTPGQDMEVVQAAMSAL